MVEISSSKKWSGRSWDRLVEGGGQEDLLLPTFQNFGVVFLFVVQKGGHLASGDLSCRLNVPYCLVCGTPLVCVCVCFFFFKKTITSK